MTSPKGYLPAGMNQSRRFMLPTTSGMLVEHEIGVDVVVKDSVCTYYGPQDEFSCEERRNDNIPSWLASLNKGLYYSPQIVVPPQPSSLYTSCIDWCILRMRWSWSRTSKTNAVRALLPTSLAGTPWSDGNGKIDVESSCVVSSKFHNTHQRDGCREKWVTTFSGWATGLPRRTCGLGSVKHLRKTVNNYDYGIRVNRNGGENALALEGCPRNNNLRGPTVPYSPVHPKYSRWATPVYVGC